KLFTIAHCRFNHSASCKLVFSGNAEPAPAQTRGNDDRDRLKLFTAAERDAFRFQIDMLDVDVGPEIEIAIFRLLDEAIAQLAAILSPHPRIIGYRVVNREQLSSDFFASFQHE